MAELQLLRAEVRLGGVLRTAGVGAEVAWGQAVRGARAPKGAPLGRQLPPDFEVGRSHCHSGEPKAADT